MGTLLLVGFALVGIALVVTAFLRPRVFLFTVGFVIPLMTLSLTLGINIQWFRFVGPLSLVLLPFAAYRNVTALRERRLWLFIGYLLVVTIGWMVLEYGFLKRYALAQSVGFGTGQTSLKMPIQLSGWLFQLSAFFIIPTRARNREDVMAGVSGFLAGCAFSIVCGLLLWLGTGHGAVYDHERSTSTIFLSSVSLPRIGGLSGEPKHLGAWLVIALAFLAAFYPTYRRTGRRLVARRYVSVFVVGLFLTYSTSAWIGLVLTLPVHGALSALWRKRSRTMVAVFAVTVVLAGFSQSPFFREVFERRVSERVLADGGGEVRASKNSFVWAVYSQKPMLAFIGFGAGGFDLEATDHLVNNPRYYLLLERKVTPTPSTTGLRVLGDVGVFGLFLLVGFVWSVSTQLRSRRYQDGAMFAVTGLVAMMLISFNVISSYLFLLGACTALAAMGQKQDE